MHTLRDDGDGSRSFRIRLRIVLLFLGILISGLAIASDYGISWDEKAMITLGRQVYAFIVEGSPYPASPGIRFHGSMIEVFLYALPEILGLRYARHIFILRHAVSFLFFWGALVAIYAYARRHFGSRIWAILAVLFLLLSPRQFGHAFINTRDIPTMMFFLLQMLTLRIFLEKRTIPSALLHGLASGLLLALRVGVLFGLLFTVLFTILDSLHRWGIRHRTAWVYTFLLLCSWATTTALTTVIFWPLLWQDPLRNFLAAAHNMVTSQNNPGGFYFGEHIGALPWHWVPVHLLIQTPLLYSALAITATGGLLWNLVRRGRPALYEKKEDFFILLWCTVPVITVIVLQADLFDEWRHLYFIYPAVILLAVSGLSRIWSVLEQQTSAKVRRGVVVLFSLPLLSTVVSMVSSHPLQYMYYSLPSRFIEGNFELDYWGLAFRPGLEWILEHDSSPRITAFVSGSAGWDTLNILTREQRKRLIIVGKASNAKYALDNFRWKEYQRWFPPENLVHSIHVSGMEILAIYRNPKWSESMLPAVHPDADFESVLLFVKEITSR